MGASLHDILSKLKAQPSIFREIDVFYSSTEPLSAPCIIHLPANGLRLRFDGPCQYLRLIEVLDFSYTPLTYEGRDVVKITQDGGHTKGPVFRHIYDRLLGPTFPGEYIPPLEGGEAAKGSYVLSYPGISFAFPLIDSAWSSSRDFVSLLTSSNAEPAKSMAIFDGEAWKTAREGLYTRPCPLPRSFSGSSRQKEQRPEEIDHVIIRPTGELEFVRRAGQPFCLNLNSSTAQDLITELGAPDAIYRKSDRRLSIHKRNRKSRSAASASELEESTDTDHSSHAVTDESDDDEGLTTGGRSGNADAECFYNYFHHGIDVFMSLLTATPERHPIDPEQRTRLIPSVNPDHFVVTKVLLYGNIPGSYPFNRYRRCRWKLDYPPTSSVSVDPLNSETPFSSISDRLERAWPENTGKEGSERNFSQGMVLNRGWANSPGSSCELLGGWEEGERHRKVSDDSATNDESPGSGNTELFGYPGLVFEVLKNDTVSCLTVY